MYSNLRMIIFSYSHLEAQVNNDKAYYVIDKKGLGTAKSCTPSVQSLSELYVCL